MTYEIVAPDPGGTIKSLSALGYSLEAAIADLVDNSIDASASRVEVRFHWEKNESYVAVIDNGTGMDSSELRAAMAFALRGPETHRRSAELGRFGMGLKTASFSQASRLIVWSKKKRNGASVRIWDLNHVAACREWQLLDTPNVLDEAILIELAQGISDQGTIVVWRDLTKLTESTDSAAGYKHFLESISRVETHLSMVFHRFLAQRRPRKRAAKLTIRVNNAAVQPWDPLMEDHPATLAQPSEHLLLNQREITVQPFILPPKRRLTDEEYKGAAGPRGWVDQQGFYVYRNDRLIVPGSWLQLSRFKKDERHVLARIAIDLPGHVDHLWSLDIKKATAQPPLSLKEPLTRIAKATRVEAQRVLTATGQATALTKSDDLTYIWRPTREEGELRLRLNWQHPLLKEVLKSSPETKQSLRALLAYIEETVPVQALRIMYDHEQDREYKAFSSSTPEEVIAVADRIYGAYISNGLTPSQAQIRLMHTPPFNEYPTLLDDLHLR